ncbi:30S ribosomal protein S3, partial [Candidatus Micrarchaeota archaeon]|nr:30S ribosomal protein S3 [Candidatus Micrarchaeota archaeon]
ERKFIKEAIKRVKAKDYIKKTLEKAGIIDVDIQRTTLNTRINVIAERPGLVIGRKGGSIKELSDAMERDLGIENPQIEVADVARPNLEPAVIARMIKRMIEKGVKPKKALKAAAFKVMGAGAQGTEITVDGTQSKGMRSRKDRIQVGYIKKSGDSVKFIKEARDQALQKQGIIGITVRIVPPEVVFPDKIIIRKPVLAEIAEETEPSAGEKKAAENVVLEGGVAELAGDVKTTPEEHETAKEALKTVVEDVKKEAKEDAKKEKPREDGTFKCDECGRTFTSERGLKAHVRIHK